MSFNTPEKLVSVMMACDQKTAWGGASGTWLITTYDLKTVRLHVVVYNWRGPIRCFFLIMFPAWLFFIYASYCLADPISFSEYSPVGKFLVIIFGVAFVACCLSLLVTSLTFWDYVKYQNYRAAYKDRGLIIPNFLSWRWGNRPDYHLLVYTVRDWELIAKKLEKADYSNLLI